MFICDCKYRKLLNMHGLRLEYDKSSNASRACKIYNDTDGSTAMIVVIRTRKRKTQTFTIYVGGSGFHRNYFNREADVLERDLKAFGEVKVVKK